MKKNTLRKEKIPFTQVPNNLVNDIKTSLKAKGLYLHMVSKPYDWNFTIFSMSKQIKDGETAIRNALSELKKLGWVMYKKSSDGSGEYFINYVPKLENPHEEKTNMGKPNCGYSTRINNKEPSNTYKENNKEQTNREIDTDISNEYIVDYLQHIGFSIAYSKKLITKHNDNLDLITEACVSTDTAIAKQTIKTTNQKYFFGILNKLQEEIR